MLRSYEHDLIITSVERMRRWVPIAMCKICMRSNRLLSRMACQPCTVQPQK